MRYLFIYPFCAFLLAVVAIIRFPFVDGFQARHASFTVLLYYLVIYAFVVFMLLFCFLLLRRIVLRSLAFLLQLPCSFWTWNRMQHLIPIFLSLAILAYLLLHLFVHTLLGIGLVFLWEGVFHERLEPGVSGD